VQEIFLDTAYAIALSAPTDEHFQQAGFRALMRELLPIYCPGPDAGIYLEKPCPDCWV